MYDIIIKNGLIYDGTGNDGYYADIGIAGDKIVEIAGCIDAETAREVIDGTGKCVTPGFIDPHTHVDMSVLFAPEMEPYLRQGVTTVVTGNCGHSPAPMGDEVYRGPSFHFEIQKEADPSCFNTFSLMLPKEKAVKAVKNIYGVDADWDSMDSFLSKCDILPLGCNMVPLVGHNAVRNAVMGMDCLRESTEAEIILMESHVEDCMQAGAFGFSTGRDPAYIPGPYATMEEMTRMLKIVSKYSGVFTSHTYNYDKAGLQNRIGGYKEMFDLARAAGVRINVSHVHTMGMGEPVTAAQKTLELFEQMKKEGIDISYDVIPDPFAADFTTPYFAYFLKPFVQMSGTRAHLAENFRVPDFRRMMHHVIHEGFFPSLDNRYTSNWFGIICINRHKDDRFIGKSIAECAELLNMDPLDAVMHIFAIDPDMGANFQIGGSCEAVDILCGSKMAMPCSDGQSYSKETNLTGDSEMPLYINSTNVSYIPRFLKRQGKDNFADAVYRASGFVAKRFGISYRGAIKKGFFADIVILDRAKLCGVEDKINCLEDPEGFECVMVNGRIALRSKQLLCKSGGKVLRKAKGQS